MFYPENPNLKGKIESTDEKDFSSEKPTFMQQIIEIRKEKDCDLFDALVEYALRLPDYREYNWLQKDDVISAAKREKEKREKEAEIEVRKRKREEELLTEGKSKWEILKILRDEGLIKTLRDGL